MTLSPELTLANRYRLVSRIAVGGMGEVWRAQDELLGRLVAVKVLKAEYVGDPDFIERFRQEARHTAALSHPGIANVFDYGEVREAGTDSPLTAYLVMEYVDGEPLSALLARGRLEPSQTLDIVGQAGLALQAAHDAGVVH
ncbi:MAG: protein kinase, partial [Actinomycetota bacterium]|nr:protein kinase [Actinomycetota bacterium]